MTKINWFRPTLTSDLYMFNGKTVRVNVTRNCDGEISVRFTETTSEPGEWPPTLKISEVFRFQEEE